MKWSNRGTRALLRAGAAAKALYGAYRSTRSTASARTRSGFPYKGPRSRTLTKRKLTRRTRFKSRVPGPVSYTRKRKRTDAVFRASQFQYAKRRLGKKRSGAFVRNRLVSTSVHTMRLRHSNITDWTGDPGTTGYLRGQAFLGYSPNRDANPALTTLPVRLFNLTSTYQSSTNIAAPMWELVYDTTAASFRWFSNYGRTSTATTSQAWQLENNSAFGASVGGIRDKGFLRWSRARLLFYGKQQQDTKITVQLVQFIKEELTPENYSVVAGYTDPVNDDAREGLDTIVKPLINNPIASQIRNQKRFMKVLKTYTIDIDPTMSIDNDKDVDRRTLDIFNRWDRVINFTPPNPNLSTLAMLEDPNKWPAPVISNSVYPTVPYDKTKCIYLLIKSHQPNFLLPDAEGPPPTRGEDTTASFDWNIQSCWQEIADG